MRVRHTINYRSQTLFQLGLMFPDFPGHMPSFNSVDLPLDPAHMAELGVDNSGCL